MNERVRWLASAHRLNFTDEQQRCAETLCALAAPYNWHTPGPIPGASLAIAHGSMSLLWLGAMATFDDDRLTALVLAAHRLCVRVEISPYKPHANEERTEQLLREIDDEFGTPTVEQLSCLELRVHARHSRTGWLSERHPTLAAASPPYRLEPEWNPS